MEDEAGELGSGLMCFRQKIGEEKKTLRLFTSKGRTTTERQQGKKSGRYVHSTTEEKKEKNGLSTVAFHPTKGEIMIEREDGWKKKSCKLLLRSLPRDDELHQHDKMDGKNARWPHTINQFRVHVGEISKTFSRQRFHSEKSSRKGENKKIIKNLCRMHGT